MVDDGWAPRERGWLVIKALVLLGAVLWPLKEYRYPREQRVDGFPLSFYPMFSKHRKPVGRVVYAVGVSSSGERRFLPHQLIGPGGENQVRHQLFRAAIRENRAQEVADRVARRVLEVQPQLLDVLRVEIVSGRFDLDHCMLTRRFEADETVLATASLPPTAPTSAPDEVSPAAVD